MKNLDCKKIYEQSLHIKINADMFQACIFIAGCYGFVEDWKQLRWLYSKPHTYGNVYSFIVSYRSMCGKLLKKYGFNAWYHTLTFSL